MAVKDYYTWLCVDSYPITENEPYLYPTREECIEALISALWLEEDVPRNEFREEEETIRRAFERGDFLSGFLDRSTDYIILKCHLQSPVRKIKKTC